MPAYETICGECKKWTVKEVVHEDKIRKGLGARRIISCFICDELLRDGDKYARIKVF